MRDSAETSFSLSTVLCQEDETCLNQLEDESKTSVESNPCFLFDNDDEYVENLIQKEAHCFESKGFKDCPVSDCCFYISCSVPESLWILQTGAVFGFQLQTAYLSVTYFDGFLSKRSIDDEKLWAIRLLSVACLSLAAKMEECKIPALSDYRFRYDYDFESKVIQRMELLVLNTLEWKLGTITPFDYLHYFINKFCADQLRPKELASNAIRLVVAMAKEIDLMDTRPSIIAAAAVLAASDGQLSRKILELKMNVISFLQSQDYEYIYSCYDFMQEIVERKDKTPAPKFSNSPLSIHSYSMEVLETSPIGTKRRLTFGDSSDQSYPTKKIHQP
nr:LOW QUALITY PROTEIN: cyclin-D5-1 [Malus domestica]